MTIRVVVVDDQDLVRSGFVALIGAQTDMEVVAEASDGEAGVKVVQETRPDVVVMDVRMPELDGIEATRRITETDDPPAVLMLTTFDLDDYVYGALRAGASGFLLKDTNATALLDAIRVMVAGDALLSPAVTRRLITEFANRPDPATPPESLEVLTPREREVLAAVARGTVNADIAAELFMSEATVKTHITRIMAKLHCSSRAQLVVAAYESGLVTPGGSADA